MHPHFGVPEPPRTLAQRLTQLNGSLQALGERLKSSIAGVVGDAVAEAVRDVVRSLLGNKETQALAQQRDFRQHQEFREHPEPTWRNQGAPAWNDRAEQNWNEDEGSDWSAREEFFPPRRETLAPRTDQPRRWRNALSAALQACLWWLKRQPRRRPVLTTLAVSLAAGVTGFVAGPTLVACAGVCASLASVLLMSEASRSAGELAAG